MRTYYFTFLTCHYTEDGIPLGNYYIRILAPDYGEARRTMFSVFDDKWGFQYGEEDMKGQTEEEFFDYPYLGCLMELSSDRTYDKIKVING